MSQTFEIPLRPQAQSLTVQLGTTVYNLRLVWLDVPMGGWLLDINDANGNPILCGVPLVTGVDLLAQYPDLAFGGKLFVGSDGDLTQVPGYSDLGVTSHLWWSQN